MIDDTLVERGSRYGDFAEHARITQNLKRALADSPNWAALPDDMKEALEMVAHKLGRILNGDPNYHDSWHDMIGYIKLVERRLCPADTTQPTSSGIKKPLSKSKSERSETRPDMTLSEPEKSIRETDLTLTTAAHWPKAGPTPLLIGGFDRDMPTAQKVT